MTKSTLEAEAILKRAAPLTHQQAHEIQPFGHLVRMPIALSEQTCKESVENLNQLLADTMTLRDLQETSLADRRPDVLSASPPVRQALQRAERACRQDRRARSAPGRRERRDGTRCRGDDAHSPGPQGSRRGTGADLSLAARARDRAERS